MGDCDYKAIVGGRDAQLVRTWRIVDGAFRWEYGFACRAADLPLALAPMKTGWYDVIDLRIGEVALTVRADNLSDAREKVQPCCARIAERHARAVRVGRDREFRQRLRAVCRLDESDAALWDFLQQRTVLIPDAVLRSPFVCRTPAPVDMWMIRSDGYTTVADGRPYGMVCDRQGRWEITDLRTGVCIMPREHTERLRNAGLRQVVEYLTLYGRGAVRKTLGDSLMRLETDLTRFALREKLPDMMQLPPEWVEWYLQAGLTVGAEVVAV